jgi:hypothetical protein
VSLETQEGADAHHVRQGGGLASSHYDNPNASKGEFDARIRWRRVLPGQRSSLRRRRCTSTLMKRRSVISKHVS